MTPPTPWRIIDTGSAFRIEDARGRGIAWVYYRREDALRNEYLSPDEAREMAQRIARLSREEPGEEFDLEHDGD